MPTAAPPLIPMTEAATGSPDRLAADLTTLAPGTQLLSAPPIGGACGAGSVPVTRVVLPEGVLFDTDSDQPRPAGAGALDQIAAIVRRDAPGAQLTILGHTDAIGSDAYNMDLSRRRAAKVLRALADRGLSPAQLTAVAIGKRQPIADDGTPEGRARNRRAEILLSRCLGGNLSVVRRNGGIGPPAAVMRLDPAAGLAPIGSIALSRQTDSAPQPKSLPAAALPAYVRPPPAMARPAPAPRYQPKSLSPDAQPSTLGPAVPF